MNKAVFPGGYPYVYSHYGFMQEYKKQPWLWLFGLYWGSPSVIIGILKLPVMSFPIQLIGSSCWGLQFEAYRLKVPAVGDMCRFKFPSKISRQHFNRTNLVTNQALAGCNFQGFQRFAAATWSKCWGLWKKIPWTYLMFPFTSYLNLGRVNQKLYNQKNHVFEDFGTYFTLQISSQILKYFIYSRFVGCFWIILCGITRCKAENSCWGCTLHESSIVHHTVDGRNPAPVDR